MGRQKNDWAHYLAPYESRGLKHNDYSQAGINPVTLRYHLYKKPKREQEEQEDHFEELPGSCELNIVRAETANFPQGF